MRTSAILSWWDVRGFEKVFGTRGGRRCHQTSMSKVLLCWRLKAGQEENVVGIKYSPISLLLADKKRRGENNDTYCNVECSEHQDYQDNNNITIDSMNIRERRKDPSSSIACLPRSFEHALDIHVALQRGRWRRFSGVFAWVWASFCREGVGRELV